MIEANLVIPMTDDECLLVSGREKQVKKEILVESGYLSNPESDSASKVKSKSAYSSENNFIFEPNDPETPDIHLVARSRPRDIVKNLHEVKSKPYRHMSCSES